MTEVLVDRNPGHPVVDPRDRSLVSHRWYGCRCHTARSHHPTEGDSGGPLQGQRGQVSDLHPTGEGVDLGDPVPDRRRCCLGVSGLQRAPDLFNGLGDVESEAADQPIPMTLSRRAADSPSPWRPQRTIHNVTPVHSSPVAPGSPVADLADPSRSSSRPDDNETSASSPWAFSAAPAEFAPALRPRGDLGGPASAEPLLDPWTRRGPSDSTWWRQRPIHRVRMKRLSPYYLARLELATNRPGTRMRTPSVGPMHPVASVSSC
jgi:hypothetical protein